MIFCHIKVSWHWTFLRAFFGLCSKARMVLLYEHPLSPYAQKVKIALVEKGVAFDCRLPDLMGGQDPEFAAANPRLEVPALVDGETSIFDSSVILEYIEERWPTPALLPPTPAERARVRMLEELCDTYYEAINWAAMEIRVFRRATGELADRLLARGTAQVAGANAYLERQLENRPWFNGPSFGWGICPSYRPSTRLPSRETHPPGGLVLPNGTSVPLPDPAWRPPSRPPPRACRASR